MNQAQCVPLHMLAFIEEQDRNFCFIKVLFLSILIRFVFIIGQFTYQIALKAFEGQIIRTCGLDAKGIKNVPQEGIPRNTIMENNEFDCKAFIALEEGK